jgi:hypothetical protein
VVDGTHVRRNIPVPGGKVLSPIVDKICRTYLFNEAYYPVVLCHVIRKKSKDISEEHTASIFRIEVWVKRVVSTM